MRTLRLSLVGAVILGLLGGLSGAVVAQPVDEQETPAATYVTGVLVSEDVEGEYSLWEMDWSDPRLPSRMLYQYSSDGGFGTHPDGSVMAVGIAAVVRLEGPDGSWSGTDRVLHWTLEPESGDEYQETWTELLVLDGEGGYEGLSATFTSAERGYGPGPYEGFIFERELPQMPDPIEPTSE